MSTPSSSPRISPSNRFEVLDLIRGIAAISVLIYHSVIYLGFQLLPDAYLAVDLFFLLSGFVIAHNYDSKIQNGMPFRQLMLQRFIRLYPCYVLAFAIGLVLDSGRLIRNNGFVDGVGLAGAGIPNLFMLPSLTSVYGVYSMYPFNGASWSLLFELIANAIYWRLYRFLTGQRLVILLVVSAAAYIAAARHSGTVDVGMRNGEALMGLCRVIVTFFGGVAIRRYVYQRVSVNLGLPGIVMVIMALIGAFYCSMWVPTSYQPTAQVMVVLILFPLLLTSVIDTRVGPRMSAVCRLSGDVSYPVYIIQTPLFFLFAAIPEIFFHHRAIAWAPQFGVFVIVAIIGVSWWVDRYYEWPLRRMLRARLLPESGSRVLKSEGGY